MTKNDIDTIILAVCPNDKDYEKPIISPKYLRQELEQLALEQQPTGKMKEYAEEIKASAKRIHDKGYVDGYHKGYKSGAEAVAFHYELLKDELIGALENLPTQLDSAGQDRFLAYDVIRTVKEFFEGEDDERKKSG